LLANIFAPLHGCKIPLIVAHYLSIGIRSWLFFESESHDDAVAWVQALSWLKDFVNGCPGSLDENDEKMSLISHTPVVSYAYDKSAKFQQEVGVAKVSEFLSSQIPRA
jgi:hypothetical protein